MEDRPGYHATGRSAATYAPNYGPAAILALTRASAAFFSSPPEGFATSPLLMPRLTLFLATHEQAPDVAALRATALGLEEISIRKACSLWPVLNTDYPAEALIDKTTADIDVDLLHQGYLRLFRERGGAMLLSHPVTAITRQQTQWHVTAGPETLTAPIIVNAAGAWGDVVAQMAGVVPAGLTPKRRSIGVIAGPATDAGQPKLDDWPFAIDVGEQWYCRPQSGNLLVSSADATPTEPHDAYADDMAIAEGLDHLAAATTIRPTRPLHAWGGLRSFVADGNPVVGFDPHCEGFFWLIGQGGYGIQSAPALSEMASCLVRQEAIPGYVLAFGLNPTTCLPHGFTRHD
jgi:D-arginine dehydrogenase